MGQGNMGNGRAAAIVEVLADWSRVASARIGQRFGPIAALVRMSSCTCHHAGRLNPVERRELRGSMAGRMHKLA